MNTFIYFKIAQRDLKVLHEAKFNGFIQTLY